MNYTNCANVAFTNATQYFYTFYGQLAGHHLQQKQITIPTYPNPDNIVKQAFFSDIVVQSAYIAYIMKNQSDVRILISSIAERKNKHRATFPLLEKLTRELGDLKTYVKVAKSASKNNDFLMIGYPIINLQQIKQIPEIPLVYALTRQESEFDTQAQSHVGARGLMQIMPSTGKQLARQLGKPFQVQYLTQNPAYNMTLGGYYIKNLINRFNGSYIHALSGYNAGPSRIPQWNVNYGKFQNNLYQIIDRIETIPFNETRNYVQRILENLQVYRSKLKQRNYIDTNEFIADLHRGL
jgi:soluble lytic murein transglycosylase